MLTNTALAKASHLAKYNNNGVRVSTPFKKGRGRCNYLLKVYIIYSYCPLVSMEKLSDTWIYM